MLKETLSKMNTNQKVAATIIGVLTLIVAYQYVALPLIGRVKNSVIVDERTKGM